MEAQRARDIEAAKRILGGEVFATEAFVSENYAPVFRFLRQLTGHVQEAEDLTQQAFIKAKQEMGSFRGDASLRSWLFRIAFHEYTHWKRRHRPTLSLEFAPGHTEAAYTSVLDAEALLSALSRLPESHRVAFLLHEVQELSIREVSQVTRVPQGTVKSRLFHARRRLMCLLDGRQEIENEIRPALES
jgi:RNA polymerase sigma-70 factor (ECF subfamily)